MGWVSTSEDIEELRQENEHYRGSIDNLIVGIRKARALTELKHSEAQLVDLSNRLISIFEEKKERAQALLDEAIRLLQDPNTRISDKLNKRIKERDSARSERDAALGELTRARASQTKALERARAAEAEVKLLRQQLQRIEDQDALSAAMDGVAPLRSKR